MPRPRCITYNLASVDGRLTLAPGVNLMAGDERWSALTEELGDPYAWVRATHDPEVLLEGSGSLLQPEDGVMSEDPAGPVAAPPDTAPDTAPGPAPAHHLPTEIVKVPGRRWFTVVDGRGRVDLQFTQWPDPDWADWYALVLTSEAAPAEQLARLRERGIPYLVAGRGRVDLPAAMELLGSRLGVRTVVCTGGGRLGGAMLRAGLVDEVDIDVLPAVIGGRGTPALFDAPPLTADERPTPLRLMSCEPQPTGVVRLRYEVRQ